MTRSNKILDIVRGRGYDGGMIKRAAAITAIIVSTLIDIDTSTNLEYMTFRSDARLDTTQIIDLRSLTSTD